MRRSASRSYADLAADLADLAADHAADSADLAADSAADKPFCPSSAAMVSSIEATTSARTDSGH
jgi:hypothetical protein